VAGLAAAVAHRRLVEVTGGDQFAEQVVGDLLGEMEVARHDRAQGAPRLGGIGIETEEAANDAHDPVIHDGLLQTGH